MNKTKIVATIGPASQEKETLKQMILAGMDVVRLNLSHASYDFCLDIADKIKELNKELKTTVAIMIDLNGPDIRIGKLTNGKAHLKTGDKIRIYMDGITGDETKFSISYPKLIDDIKYNTKLLLREGKIELSVVDKELNYILCEVITGGDIESGDGISIPEIKLKIPFLNRKDKDDILFAHKMKADFLALSYVNTAEDVLEVNDLLIEMGDDHIGLLAKIEKESAVEEIDEIIKVSDGIIVARGDLGVEVPMERIPGIQKSIISKCHLMGKVSLIATEFLSSMENDTRPTRAEVSDVANAVIDSTDGIVLSGETTIGKYPIETVMMMDKIIDSAEGDINYYELLDKSMRSEKQDVTGSLVYSVTECANRLKTKAIIAPTMSGYTARKMSRFRPSCPIIAVSPDENTVKSLALHFAVRGVLIDDIGNFDKIVTISKRVTKELIPLERGDKLIITGGYPFTEVKHTNFMKIEEI
ncbi:MAG: pyruvate kinase [Bacilli bacterium]|nr:pyruvate kinase [Bacilli bacterium]